MDRGTDTTTRIRCPANHAGIGATTDGWPNGKCFAVVLTHDVEGHQGLDKCRQLMELETKLGFRSSFSFISEGTYRVNPDFRMELVQNGLEICVHDLRDNGRLYRSRRDFTEKAERINRYLKEWDAVGFRSGFMLHNLDWLHELGSGRASRRGKWG